MELARSLSAAEGYFLATTAEADCAHAEAKVVQPSRRVPHRWRDGGAPARLSPALSRSTEVRESNRVDAREPDLILCLLASHRRLPLARRPFEKPILDGLDHRRRGVAHNKKMNKKKARRRRSLWAGGKGDRSSSLAGSGVVGACMKAQFAAAGAAATNSYWLISSAVECRVGFGSGVPPG